MPTDSRPLRRDPRSTGSDLLTVHVDDGDATGATVVTVTGEIDLLTVGVLRDALQDTITESARLVIIDMEHVRFMGSAGVSQLLDALAQANLVHCELRLAGAGDAVRLPLRLTGTDGHFEHTPTVVDAIGQPLVRL